MSRRKPLVALAAITAALAVAVPTATASAATTQPTAATRLIATPFVFTPPHAFCQGLIYQIQGALLRGNPILANLLSRTFITLHCGGAAI